MAQTQGSAWGWGDEGDPFAGGRLVPSTEERLKDLLRWKGFTSFMSPAALAVGRDLRLTPIAQVVGFSGGALRQGVLRTTTPGHGRARFGRPRWRERSGPVESWDTVRRRALERLKRQAQLLDADAVVGLKPQRRTHEDEALHVEYVFTGTAVRVHGLPQSPGASPLLTLASTQELRQLLQAGVEPLGVAGAFASVQTIVSLSSVRLSTAPGRWAPNAELTDLTKSVYEARRLALERLRADARGLGAAGLIGIDIEHRQRSVRWPPGIEITVHLVASALRNRARSGLEPKPVVRLRGQNDV